MNSTKWQSYVHHEDKAFFVSTIRRDYDTYAGVVWGEETLVWEWDPKSKERGKLLYQADDHADCCEQLIRTGKYEIFAEVLGKENEKLAEAQRKNEAEWITGVQPCQRCGGGGVWYRDEVDPESGAAVERSDFCPDCQGGAS